MKMTAFSFAFLAITSGIYFAAAGRWDLPWSWATLGMLAAFMVSIQLAMAPDLRRERLKPGPGGTDRHIRLLMLPFMLGFWVVAGLDTRWHGPDTVALGWRLAGFAGLAGTAALLVWVMKHNQFFSPVVRIQSERGHHLVSTGPYAWIRHPGYLGSMTSAVSMALGLGSWWALLPIAGCLGLIVRRLWIEDAFLHRELAGYPEYARRVPHRLLPGIW